MSFKITAYRIRQFDLMGRSWGIGTTSAFRPLPLVRRGIPHGVWGAWLWWVGWVHRPWGSP